MIKKNLRDLYDYYFFWDGDQDLAMSPLDNATKNSHFLKSAAMIKKIDYNITVICY